MPIAGFLAPLISWIFRTVVVKFLVMAAVLAVVVELMPLVIEFLGTFTSTSGLTSAFNGIPAGVWFFLDFMALDVGIPLLISAHVSRFLIRRLPVIG